MFFYCPRPRLLVVAGSRPHPCLRARHPSSPWPRPSPIASSTSASTADLVHDDRHQRRCGYSPSRAPASAMAAVLVHRDRRCRVLPPQLVHYTCSVRPPPPPLSTRSHRRRPLPPPRRSSSTLVAALIHGRRLHVLLPQLVHRVCCVTSATAVLVHCGRCRRRRLHLVSLQVRSCRPRSPQPSWVPPSSTVFVCSRRRPEEKETRGRDGERWFSY